MPCSAGPCLVQRCIACATNCTVSHVLTFLAASKAGELCEVNLSPRGLICCEALWIQRSSVWFPECLSLPPAGLLIRTQPPSKNLKNVSEAEAEGWSGGKAGGGGGAFGPIVRAANKLTLLIRASTPATDRHKGGSARHYAKLTRPQILR